MQKIVFTLLLGCLLCNKSFTQQYPFIRYTPKNGLASNRVRCMMQDRHGLLYFSTFGGLSVYDGSRFTNYTTENGLFINTINDVVEMGDDSLWVILNSRNIYTLVNGKLRSWIAEDGFCPVINKMIFSADKHYYALADEGLFKLERNRFIRVVLSDPKGQNLGSFFSDGIEWNQRLFLIVDPATQAAVSRSHLVMYDVKRGIALKDSSLTTYSITVSPNGDLLAATSGGIKMIDPKALDQQILRFLSPPAEYKKIEKIFSKFIFFDRQKNFWICTDTGVFTVNSSGNLKTLSIANGLSSNIMKSIYQDRENTLWFLSNHTGIDKLADQQFEFYPQEKTDLFATDVYANEQSDSVWLLEGTRNRLQLFSKQGDKKFTIRSTGNSQPRFFISSRGEYYLIDGLHVYRAFIAQGTLDAGLPVYTDTTKNANDITSCAMTDSGGNLIFSADRLTVLFKDNKTSTYPLHHFADEFALTADNRLWVATRDNHIYLLRLHPEDHDHYWELLQAFEMEIPYMSPRSIATDKMGNIWIGTRDKGLFCLSFDGRTLQTLKHITKKDGLSDDFITYLHVDRENSVWACSEGGLDRIRLKDGNVFIENITRSDDMYQFISKIQSSEDGTRWANTWGGIVKIPPVDNTPGDFLPSIIIRKIEEGNDTLNITPGKAYLSHEQNNLRFYVAVPSYIDEKQIRFSYLLQGSGNTSWSKPSSESTINFVDLSPGDYLLKVKASFINGRYPVSEAHYALSISPPWWQSWWFKIASVVFVLLALVLMVQYYYRRKLEQQQIAMDKQKAIEKERSRIAADMHDDLGAGLSTIRFLSEKVSRNVFSEVTREDVAKMKTASNELIDKMNEIIWAMNEKNDSLEDLVLYTRSYAMEYCEENGLDYNFPIPQNIPSHFVSGEIRRNIFLMVKESLHNVVKHAQANAVDFKIETSQNLEITIRDNGRGFIQDQKASQGNGLRNMKQRIESLGGTMNIQNSHGVTIQLRIPLDTSGR